MAKLSEAFAIAREHHQAGRLEEAEEIYRRILDAEPNHAQTLHLLGVLAYQRGRYADAAASISRAIELAPTAAGFYSNLGLVFKEQGKLEEAEACWRRALALSPDFPEAHNNLGVVLQAQGMLGEAADCYRQALAIRPDYPEAHNNLGNAFKEQGKPAEALACYRRAIELKPSYAEAHNNLGLALEALGEIGEAEACYRRSLGLKPDYAEAFNNLANSLQNQGKVEEALAGYRRALERKPDYPEAHTNLGALLCELGRAEEAAACHRRAVALRPRFAQAHNNLGLVLQRQGRLDEAVECYRRALELAPAYVEAHNNLGNTLKEQGKLDEALACFRQALAIAPGFADAHSNLLYALHYCEKATLSELAEAHAEFDRLHAVPLPAGQRRYDNSRDPDRRLRLGLVSPDFGHHPVGHFLIRVLENVDRRAAEIVCYSNRLLGDDLTVRFRAAASAWHEVAGWPAARLAGQIRADGIDILFDLAGHTARNRLPVFALKPAPLQITWIGYEGTTGLGTMDYLLADAHTVPPGYERYYREQVLRMPECYVCFDPPREARPVGPLPARSRGQVTFASFSNPAKITPRVVGVWAEILRHVPESRLALKFRGLTEPSVQARFRQMFSDLGVEPGRVDMQGASTYADYLAAYQQVDIALDTFPFSGSATTCEALWMGVPVVTCPGETFASRHSLVHLSTVGLTETIARDLDEYVARAVSLGSDLERLAALRAGLRSRMEDSPLCDGRRFAGQWIGLLRSVWRQWVQPSSSS